MRKHKFYSVLFTRLLYVAAALLITGCTDTLFSEWLDEGEPTEVTLSWNIPEMKHLQRAMMSDEDSRKVNTLWVGIYNTSGRRTGSRLFTSAELQPQGDTHSANTLPAIKAEAGHSHIVAVSNVETNFGISDAPGNENSESAPNTSRLKKLSELLADATTWDKFKQISATLTDSANVSRFTTDLIMSGVYCEETDQDPVWTDVANEQTYFIPSGHAEMPGAIHLRRLISYSNFILIPAEGITFEPTSWQVFNNPIVSYLHEQDANSADVSTTLLDRTQDRDNYGTSAASYIFTPYTEDGKEVGKQFDFYLFENKHTGLEPDEKFKPAEGNKGIGYYDYREEEFKTEDKDNPGVLTNTGVFKSLCETAEGGPNNFASYVIIQGRLSYYVDADGNPTDAQHGSLRTAEANFKIHLGYCEGDTDLEKARDFNNRRNTKYTYKIYINGVNNIVVEAKKEGEYQPGMTGSVIDTGQRVYTLDCHYATFNIRLTDEQREALSYIIQAPFGSTVQTLRSSDHKDFTPEQLEALKDNQFYNWILFKPTSNEHTLQPYKKNPQDNSHWYLNDLRDVENKKNPYTTDGNIIDINGSHSGTPQWTQGKNRSRAAAAGDEPERSEWYTVFINEYVYERDLQHNDITGVNNGWHNYVNKDPRTLLLNLENFNISEDLESQYSMAYYTISQKSIQTYYTPTSTNALGVEHINETYGKNLDWSWANGSLSKSNGRWNQWQYVHGKSWESILLQNTPDDHGYPVPMLLANATPSSDRHTMAHDPAPASDGYYEIISACMSRNRDLNGNGVIDANELRWYLPATGKYERIFIGANSLETPLFNPNALGKYTNSNDPLAPVYTDPFVDMGGNNQYHYASSNKEKFYAEEGGTKNALTINWYQQQLGKRYPWNIRCIRNLGVDLNTVTENPDDDPVDRAYSFDPETSIFTMDHYTDQVLRSPVLAPLPLHRIWDLTINSPARQFQVSRQAVAITDASYSNTANRLNAIGNNIPCYDYSEESDSSDVHTWRIPNQKELMMMLFDKNSLNSADGNAKFSCTQESYGQADRIIGAYKEVTNLFRNGTDGWGGNTYHIRCVRDIINLRDTPKKRRRK